MSLKSVFSLMLLAICACLLIVVIAPQGLATTPDSVQYLNIAQTLQAGHGYNVTSHDLMKDAPVIYAQRAWPPLYPLLLSILPGDIAEQARYLSMVLLGLTLFGVWQLVRYRVPSAVAILLTLSVLLSPGIITAYAHLWSETLFLALLVGLMVNVAALLPNHDKLPSMAGLLLLAALAAALAYTRYIGVLFFINFAILLVLHRDWTARLRILVAGAVGGMLVLLLWFSNWQATGHISGAARAASNTPFIENLQQALSVMYLAVGKPAIIALLAGVLALLLPRLLKRQSLSVQGQPLLSWVLGINALMYFFAMVGVRSISLFDDLDTRLLAPVVLLLHLLLLQWVAGLGNTNRLSGFGAAVATGVLVSSIYAGISWLQVIPDNWKAQGSPGLLMNEQSRYNNFTSAIARQGFQQLLPPQAVLVSDRAAIMQYVSGVVAYQLPGQPDKAVLERLRLLPAGSALFLTRPASVEALLPLFEAQGIPVRHGPFQGGYVIQPQLK